MGACQPREVEVAAFECQVEVELVAAKYLVADIAAVGGQRQGACRARAGGHAVLDALLVQMAPGLTAAQPEITVTVLRQGAVA